ncbi:phosphotransferase [Candidatus Parcubacteria bacterium]|nr:phosphotransferase [Candidatus Parcubacteria bacterium]
MMEKASLSQGDIRNYIKEKKIFRDFKLRMLGSGLANKNFLISSNGRQYNLRTNRKRPPMNKELLAREHLALEFLKAKKINFTAHSHYYDKEENIHIVEYLPGRKIQMKNIGNAQLAQVLKCLYKINNLAPEFKAYVRKQGYKFPTATKYNRELIKRLQKDFRELYKHKEYRFVIKWVKNKINKDFKDLKLNERFIYLNHGDPVSNIIINKKKIYLIDWEQVKLAHDPGLAYIFLHGDLNNKRRQAIIKMYARLAGVEYSALWAETVKKFKQLMFEDLINLCKVHLWNKTKYNSREKLYLGLINGRMRYYDYLK